MWTHYHLHVDGWRLHTLGGDYLSIEGKIPLLSMPHHPFPAKAYLCSPVATHSKEASVPAEAYCTPLRQTWFACLRSKLLSNEKSTLSLRSGANAVNSLSEESMM